MKTFTTTAFLAVIASLAAAAPAPLDYNDFRAQIRFIGAADAQFTESVLADGSKFYINNPLSISHIHSVGGATTSFDGIDGNHTVVVGRQTVDVGRPQTQISGSCLALQIGVEHGVG